MSAALEQVFADPWILLIVLLSALYGVFIGAIPGLTATLAVALLVPVTYFMEPAHAIAAVVTLVACAIFAGDIPNTLLRIPGTPSSAAYTDDVYGLRSRGLHEKALGVCLVFSVAGGLFGSLVLLFFVESLAKVSEKFGEAAYFWLYLLGLGCAVVASRGSPLKAALGLLLGLGFATVGLSVAHGSARFTFGVPELYRGISFIPAMIGLFGFSEVLRNTFNLEGPSGGGAPSRRSGIFGSALPLLWRRKFHALRSGSIGSLVGMLPGAGADIAAWVSMGVSRRFSRKEGGDDESLSAVGDATSVSVRGSADSRFYDLGILFPNSSCPVPGDRSIDGEQRRRSVFIRRANRAHYYIAQTAGRWTFGRQGEPDLTGGRNP